MSEAVRKDIVEQFNAGFRACGRCFARLEKKIGCQWIHCPFCSFDQCWFCGDPLVHDWAQIQAHQPHCHPNKLVDLMVTKRMSPPQETRRQNGKTIEILVTTFKGTDVTVCCSPDITIQELKNVIQYKTGINANDMTSLVHHGKVLQNGLQIRQYRIENASTIFLTTPVNGG
jgi:hypothetical protein